MVQAKKATVKPSDKKTEVKTKESKEALFLRVATPRVEKVLRTLRILGNCSNRQNYGYDQEQIDKIYTTLQEALDNMIYKYTPSKAEQEKFEF